MSQALIDIVARRGTITFRDYLELALYDPDHGYYASEVRTGWGGHYLTSPEIDPLYGELWANGIERLWTAGGSPDGAIVVELGPGEGGLAAALLDAAATRPFGDALRYVLVERSPEAMERQHRLLGDRVSWVESVEDIPEMSFGIAIANEVFDNVPVHLLERSGGRTLEVWVRADSGRLKEVLAPPRTQDILRDVSLGEGQRVEVCPAADDLVHDLSTKLVAGALVAIDYGFEAHHLGARPGGTIVCYSDRGTDTEPLDRPGEKDITHHVNWTALRRAMSTEELEVLGPVTQADVLRSLGAAEADGRLHAEHAKAILEGSGADAVRALSRRQALGALLDTGGLGGLQVMVGARGLDPAALVSG